ncbi:MAG: hypothetical protein Nkreftii_002192 [Candidatus Nitrospira kreftii]|uniref:Beta/gamma crystallin 'Greek key' domain-containing protein n=1 Tax=Candidatus Nitrospira kreftii TaxID=2652173 RepID=A0A7S8FEL6_9BACT|nr:MAG: hypothetical protein Nkreftii_002192 [Candidatus Nitrospira kreftii]
MFDIGTADGSTPISCLVIGETSIKMRFTVYPRLMAGLLFVYSLAGLVGGGTAMEISQQQDNNPMKHDNKCWAEIYMNADFDKNAPRLLLVGPHELPTLKGLNDQNWDNDIESIVLGPEATMVAYEHPEFAGRTLILAANQNIGNLANAQMKNEIESLRLACK